MKIITNETGTYYIDGNGSLVHYEDTQKNDIYGSRSVISLNIPEGVIEIPDHVFRGYDVSYGIILPASLKRIGKYAFLGGHLHNITVPKNADPAMLCQFAHALRFVHTWGSERPVQNWPPECDRIYHGQSEPRENLWQLRNASGTFFIDCDGVLMGYQPEKSNVLPSESGKTVLYILHIPEGVVAIPCEMFKNCKILREITFPKSLRCIGVGSGEGNAFNWTSLPDMVFPENLENLGNYAFAHSHIRCVTIMGISPYWNVDFRRAFIESSVGMIRVPMKYRDVLDEASKGWGWSEGFEMTDPTLGRLYCVRRPDEIWSGPTVLRVLSGFACRRKAVSKITLLHASCADQTVDAVVNAANNALRAGGGICGVIFKKAGMAELTAACSKYKTPIKDGSAVITPAFHMANAKCIIHAVGPNFARTPGAFRELFHAYYNSLHVLMDNGLHSISFPLISSGIYGGPLKNPAAESARQCCQAYKKFVADYPDYEVDVKLCAFSSQEMQEVQKVFDSMDWA